MRCLNKIGNYCFDKIEELRKISKSVDESDHPGKQALQDECKYKMDAYADVLEKIVVEVKENM